MNNSNSHFSNSAGNGFTSNDTTLAIFENAFTISYPNPELPPVITTNSFFSGPNSKGAPFRFSAQPFRARRFKALLMRDITPRIKNAFRAATIVARRDAPFVANTLLRNGRRRRSRMWTGPSVRIYRRLPVTRGSLKTAWAARKLYDAPSKRMTDIVLQYVRIKGSVTLRYNSKDETR